MLLMFGYISSIARVDGKKGYGVRGGRASLSMYLVRCEEHFSSLEMEEERRRNERPD